MRRANSFSAPQTARPQPVKRASSFAQAPEKELFDAGEIVPGLWVGSLAAAEDAETLLKKHILSVVTVATRLNPQVSWTSLSSSSIANKRLDIEDHPRADLLGCLPEALRAIDKVMKARAEEALVSVLVHCASGMSRSVSVCMAWLMLRRGATVHEAFQSVKGVRPQAQPNHGFLQSLKLLEEEKGDVRSAHKLWLKANDVSAQSRNKLVLKLREKADALAEKAGTLEEQLQQQCGQKEGSTLDLEVLTKLLSKLKRLLKDIQKAVPKTTTDDSVAQAVRSVTTHKVEQLLKIWEPLLPEPLASLRVAEDIIDLPGAGSGRTIISL